MRIFVTGVSGYAGYHAALRLAGAGHTIVGLARNPDQPRLQILRMFEVSILRGDVGQPDTYRDELNHCDAVIHTMLDKKKPFETDRALFNTLENLSQREARRRFVYTTGCSIFGKVGIPLMDETVEPHPDHPLGFRRALELEAFALAGVDTVVVRPGFMYGADGYNSVSTDWFEMAAKGEAIFRGDREKGWSWIHIADLAEAYRLIVEAKGGLVSGQVFHLADDQQPKSLDVMRACLKAAQYSGEIRFEGPMKGDNISTWFDQNEFITSRKAAQVIGWIAKRPGIIEGAERAFKAWNAARDVTGV